MVALGFSKTIADSLNLMTIAELISGIILILVGSRMIRSPQR
jgi:putative Mn2+ efflux pump MntP